MAKKNRKNISKIPNNFFIKFTPPGHPSWGIAWYLNDLLIPEVYVERGQTYTFVVEGGNDETQPARFHPFYM